MAVETGETVSTPAYSRGFQTLAAEVDLASLPIEGQIPPWLSGTLIRTGPAKFEAGDRSFKHWFDGQAMLHRFSFQDGRVSYANRFLRTKAFRAAEQGRISYSEFATDPCRSIFRRAMSLFRPRLSDNCNVNLARLGEEYIAMTETPLPVAFDPQTLQTLGVAYKPPGIHATAHPHHDPGRDELVAYVTHFGPRSEYRIYAQRDRTSQRRIASLAVAEPSYMHSFAISERYLALVAFPFVVNPLRLALGGRPFIENYCWKPEQGTQVLVFDRQDGTLRGRFQAAPCFAFHHVNAFDRGGVLTIDMVAYDDASIIDALYLDRLRAQPSPELAEGRLLRYRVSIDSGRVIEEELSDATLELPQIDYRACNARPYRYVYGAGIHRVEALLAADAGPAPADFLNQLVKVDVQTGEARQWYEPGSYPGEPVFVPAPVPRRREDEGVLLSIVLQSGRAASYLVVLDAQSLAELGRAQVPHHIPFGFHGQYFGSQQDEEMAR